MGRSLRPEPDASEFSTWTLILLAVGSVGPAHSCWALLQLVGLLRRVYYTVYPVPALDAASFRSGALSHCPLCPQGPPHVAGPQSMVPDG